MKVLKATKLIGVDMDWTLATWNKNDDDYRMNERVVHEIKRFHRRGHTLVAWSAGGPEWAAQVVKRFKLTKYFTLAMGKFDWFFDDKPASEFLPEANRIFLKDESPEINKNSFIKKRKKK